MHCYPVRPTIFQISLLPLSMHIRPTLLHCFRFSSNISLSFCPYPVYSFSLPLNSFPQASCLPYMPRWFHSSLIHPLHHYMCTFSLPSLILLILIFLPAFLSPSLYFCPHPTSLIPVPVLASLPHSVNRTQGIIEGRLAGPSKINSALAESRKLKVEK